MKILSGVIVFLASGVLMFAQGNRPEQAAEPPMLGIHWARDAGGPSGGAGSSPNMTWHGGPILPSTTVQAIFWGSSWSKSSFVNDKMTGLDSLYSGEGGSAYGTTCDEYTSGKTSVGNSLTYLGHVVDTSAAAKNGSRTTPILAEVCKMIPNPVANGYYPVYIDQPRGHAGYCAWHSWGSCNGVAVEFGFFFNLDGDPGCDPQDTQTSHSQGLAALANVSGHELSETRTDPNGNAWYDASGEENADKCAWTFSGSLVKLGGSSWKIQGNWSNAAYTSSKGYTPGCVDGNQ